MRKNKTATATIPSGFDAFGHPVPAHRLTSAYNAVKEMIPDISTEDAFSIVGKCANCIERDQPFEILGSVTQEQAIINWLKTGRGNAQVLGPHLSRIDLTGRYRLLAVLLAG